MASCRLKKDIIKLIQQTDAATCTPWDCTGWRDDVVEAAAVARLYDIEDFTEFGVLGAADVPGLGETTLGAPVLGSSTSASGTIEGGTHEAGKQEGRHRTREAREQEGSAGQALLRLSMQEDTPQVVAELLRSIALFQTGPKSNPRAKPGVEVPPLPTVPCPRRMPGAAAHALWERSAYQGESSSDESEEEPRRSKPRRSTKARSSAKKDETDSDEDDNEEGSDEDESEEESDEDESEEESDEDEDED
eukprot:gene15225-21306_t